MVVDSGTVVVVDRVVAVLVPGADVEVAGSVVEVVLVPASSPSPQKAMRRTTRRPIPATISHQGRDRGGSSPLPAPESGAGSASGTWSMTRVASWGRAEAAAILSAVVIGGITASRKAAGSRGLKKRGWSAPSIR